MTASMLNKKDWSLLPRRALTPTEVVSRLAVSPGWQLTGDGE
ncbi:MAG: Pterin carbinolamine dehydratase, partial [Ramlibacter sp.]|nr:Pterin carbinolamine dehydratase [Ramlibacter sp.]